ncbi:spermidine synthase [Streptomyces sp. PT12]|uniref:spermidine synthase n=1 Tax=Streptomyces sp. PT12 TaxID=1510197 RepID=UPI000DE3BCC7|nr:spermidine synthase [Streptomyces sp. PT12]RBM23272.1 spermidine synthase [Streptomyces sp. PT12]
MAAHHRTGQPADDALPVVLDRREGPHGEVVLRRHGELFQIIANGCFLMDTSDGRSERLLVSAALEALEAPDGERPAPRVLIGGLGVGFSLAEAAAEPRWGAITVVEREPAVVDWHREGPLSDVTTAALADPRTELVVADLVDHLRDVARRGGEGGEARYDALCLDIDNGPDWTVTPDNESLYAPAGLAACADALNPGGVLAVWSARPSQVFPRKLRDAGFATVRTREVPVVRGVPDVLFLASHHLASRSA